jgi:hypothetical protein
VLFAKYNWDYQVEEDEVGGACGANVEKRHVYRLLVGKPEGKKLLGRPRHRQVNKIKMGLVGIVGSGVDWIGVALDRDKWRALVNAVMNLLAL